MRPVANTVAAAAVASFRRRSSSMERRFDPVSGALPSPEWVSELVSERERETFATAPFASSVGNTSAIFYPRLLTRIQQNETHENPLSLSLSLSLFLASPSASSCTSDTLL